MKKESYRVIVCIKSETSVNQRLNEIQVELEKSAGIWETRITHDEKITSDEERRPPFEKTMLKKAAEALSKQ